MSIEMIKYKNGHYQLSIDNKCVTGYEFISKKECYESYIKKLILRIQNAEIALMDYKAIL